jgi:hypothetical protein
MPYLMTECQRLESWKIVELWCADIVALSWFVRFSVVHAIQGEPLIAVPFEDRRRQIKTVAITGVAALLLDVVLTFNLMHDEQNRYAIGLVAEAQVLSVREVKRELKSWYEIDCRFKDAVGVARKAHLRVETSKNAFPTGLPSETAQVLRSHGERGNLIQIRYDPQFPARAWAEGAGWDDGQKVYWFSLLTLLFQAIVTALFLLLLVKHSSGSFLPWWWDIYKVLPLFVGAFWLFTMGLIDRLMNSLE